MQNCKKCNRKIRAQASVVSCASAACGSIFHTGCLRIYCTTVALASICCVQTYKAMTGHDTQSAQSPVISGSRAAAVPTANPSLNHNFPQILLPPPRMQPSAQSGAASVLPNSWASLSLDDKMSELMIKMINTENMTTGINDSVHSLIPTIQHQSEMLVDHAGRITALENRANEIPTADLMIDNIPASLESSFTPATVAGKLLDILKISHLKGDILNARNFVKKAASSTFSIIVSFKSNYIRDFVILTKRKHGKIDQAALLGFNCGTEQVYVGEFLNSPTYNLLANAKKWKRDNGWPGFIWIQNSKIFARKGSDRSVKPTLINSMSDLIQLA